LSDFDAAFQELDAKTKAQADKMDALYASIGQTISTSIVDSLTAAVDGTKRLSDVASDTLRSLANILLKFGLNSLLGGLAGNDGVGVFSKLFGGGRAKGGTVMGGTSYMVGERGPELFTPGRSGSIAPNSSMGGGANVVVNVDASGTKAEGDGRQANQLGAALGAAVQAELIKQKRPGGLLAA
jgi:phage-related minor tail protein